MAYSLIRQLGRAPVSVQTVCVAIIRHVNQQRDGPFKDPSRMFRHDALCLLGPQFALFHFGHLSLNPAGLSGRLADS